MAADMFRIYEQYSKDIKFSELQNPEESWELLDVIGEGTYGEVYSAKNKDTGILNRPTPGRRQSKMPKLSRNVDQKSLETEF